MRLIARPLTWPTIKHQYRLTSETGPAHKKVFTVTLRLARAARGRKRGAHQHALPAPAAPRTARDLCQPAVYCTVAPIPGRVRPRAPPFRVPVRVCVGGRAWLGEGSSPQAARHDAAARALLDLRPQHPSPDPPVAGETEADLLNSEVKSPVSLVHELALKRNLNVIFSVKSERGPPHMRVFITVCKVGDMETEGEGNGKKVSKRRAAECMLEEMKRRKVRRWMAVLRAAWAVRWAAARARSTTRYPSWPWPATRPARARRSTACWRSEAPRAAGSSWCSYRVLEERGAARRREFLVQYVLLAMEMAK
ncbi:unnamed protein product [Leptidea sinapis]|uniref:DRBM domain-containing protein n=1 Tax=Leptidea sinapis TaxID=189913 RepID=A0A5E4QVI4_9NEOP|nr:unnamed protein product [Leptidea sinapis]